MECIRDDGQVPVKKKRQINSIISHEMKKMFLTLNDVTNMVIDRRRNIVPPNAKNRRRIILLEKEKLSSFSPKEFFHQPVFVK